MTIEGAGQFAEPDDSGATYAEHLRRPDLSVGTYSLRAGAVDPQSPHGEDEVYAVTSGRGRFTSGGRTIDVGAGSVFFVPAGEGHRFHDITEDLAVLVLFGPAEGSRATPEGGAPTAWAGITGNTVTTMESVTVRELRNHGGDVLDRVARGEALVVTRDGAEVAELRPRARRSPSPADLIARRSHLPTVDPDGLRGNLDSVLDAGL